MAEDALRKCTGSNLLVPLVQIIAVVAIGLIGWLLISTNGQAQDLSEVKVKTDIYFSKIDDNTVSIQQNTDTINTLSKNFDDFKTDTAAWQANADLKFGNIASGINSILEELERINSDNNKSIEVVTSSGEEDDETN